MNDIETVVHAHHVHVPDTSKTIVLNYSSDDGKSGELFQLDNLTELELNNLAFAVALERIRRTHNAEASVTAHIKLDGK